MNSLRWLGLASSSLVVTGIFVLVAIGGGEGGPVLAQSVVPSLPTELSTPTPSQPGDSPVPSSPSATLTASPTAEPSPSPTIASSSATPAPTDTPTPSAQAPVSQTTPTDEPTPLPSPPVALINLIRPPQDLLNQPIVRPFYQSDHLTTQGTILLSLVGGISTVTGSLLLTWPWVASRLKEWRLQATPDSLLYRITTFL